MGRIYCNMVEELGDIYYSMSEEVTVVLNVDVGGSNGCISCIMVEGLRNVFTVIWWKE